MGEGGGLNFYYLCVSNVLFTVVTTCPILCRGGRDSNVSSERELSQFIRKLMRFVCPSSVIPAEYEVKFLLKPVDHEYVFMDENLYKLHSGQYFRYDVRTQLPFFYRSVQKLLGVVCRKLSSTWQRGTIGHLSLIPFDLELVHLGFDDRCINALVGACTTHSRFHLMDDSTSTVLLRQYREVAQLFQKKCSLTDLPPAVDDVISLWLSYPFWSRCQELLAVFKVLFGLSVVGSYVPDFVDEVDVAMPKDTLRSILHLVRICCAISTRATPVRLLPAQYEFVIPVICKCPVFLMMRGRDPGTHCSSRGQERRCRRVMQC